MALNKKKILKRIALAVLIAIVLLAGTITFMLNSLVTPERITPVVLKLAEKHIKGNVECESIDITFFSTFPNLGIKLSGGSISSERDTLIAFETLVVAVNPVDFIKNNKLNVRHLSLENADIYAFVDTVGIANWDIFIGSPDEEEEDVEDVAFEFPELNINSIRLRNVNLTYDDLEQDMLVMVDSIDTKLKGNLSKSVAQLNLSFRTTGITYYTQGETLFNNLPVAFHTEMERDRVKKNLAIRKGLFRISSVEINTDGLIERKDTVGKADIDLNFSVNASSVNDLMKMIPASTSDIASKFVANGKLSVTGKAEGEIARGLYPVVTLAFMFEDGSLAAPKYSKKPFIEDLDIDLTAVIDVSGRQPSSMTLNKLYLQTADSKINAEGTFGDLLTKPSINASAKADIDFTKMAKKLPLKDLQMEGIVDMDMSINCLLSDIMNSNYGKINANGYANIKNVVINYPAEKLLLYTSNAELKLGSNTQDTIRGELKESLLRGKISLDTLNLSWNDYVKAETTRLSVVIDTSEPKDSAAIAPIMTGGRAKKIHLVMGDSVRMHATAVTGAIRTAPQAANPALPEINAKIMIDSLFGRAYEVGGRVSKAELSLKMTRQADRRQGFVRNMIARTDSTARPSQPRTERGFARDTTLTRAQLDSLRQLSLDPTTNLSFRLESAESRSFLRQWEISGSFASQDASMRTPYFPIPIRLRDADMTFTSDELRIKKTHMILGNSDFSIKGGISGIRRALLNNGRISTKMDLAADSMDFNELIRAAVKGSEYMLTGNNAVKDSIVVAILDQTQEIVTETQDGETETGVFVIPKNLDAEFNSNIRNAKFADVSISSMKGRIILRDQAVQLSDFVINSDIGAATTSLVYKAPDISGAYLGFELKLNKVDIKELIEAMPSIDELTPMLRSFEGVVDCDITALTELDSLMNVKLPQTTASCFMSGQNLVLLDGETFAEISKTLMFKNKNRNQIDSLSVEMILEDEKLMIFPFQITMDRYKAAVGGVQNLDMSFDYHITVLQSPVPFKLGLNITGNPDDMKIRLGKAKYKNLFTAASEKKVQTTINLREEMDKQLKQSITSIIGNDFSQPVRRPRSEMPDSLRRELFQLVDEPIATSPIEAGDIQTADAADSLQTMTDTVTETPAEVSQEDDEAAVTNESESKTESKARLRQA